MSTQPIDYAALVKASGGELLSAPQPPSDVSGKVVSAAKANGVDEHLARAIAKNESSFKPNAVSSAGAKGVMQLMPGTAHDMGVSDPMDADQSIEGGVKYLKRLQAKYGDDWTKVASAYHAGPGNVDAGKIGPATRQYVTRVLRDRDSFAKQAGDAAPPSIDYAALAKEAGGEILSQEAPTSPIDYAAIAREAGGEILPAATPAPAPRKADVIAGTAAFGGELPAMPKPPIPPELGTGVTAGGFRNPRTGQVYDRGRDTGTGPLGILDAPTQGIPQMVRGVERMAEPDLPNKAAGLTDVIGGATRTALPLLPGAAAAAPVGTAVTMGLATGTQKLAQKGLESAGVRPEYSELGGTVAGLLVGAGGAGLLLRKAYAAAGSPELKVGGKFEEPKAFRDMSDEELVSQANAIERDPPRNYKWQKGQIVQEASRRQAERGMPAGNQAPAPESIDHAALARQAGGTVERAAAPAAEPAPVIRGEVYDTPSGAVRVAGVTKNTVLYRSEGQTGTRRVTRDQFRALTAVQPSAQATSPKGEPQNKQPDVVSPQSSEAVLEPASAASVAPAVASPEPETSSSTPKEPATQHDYSSTQVNLPEEIASHIRTAAQAIPDSQLAKDGREDEPHITVKYGLHGDDPAPVRELLAGEGPIIVTLGKASVFPAKETTAQRGGDQYDVLKIDVDSPELHALNKKIADALPHTDTHPKYQPHVTLAYLKPGEGKQYDGHDVPGVTGQQVTLNSLRFSSKGGNKVDIPLNGKPSGIGPQRSDVAPEAESAAAVAPQSPAAATASQPATRGPQITDAIPLGKASRAIRPPGASAGPVIEKLTYKGPTADARNVPAPKGQPQFVVGNYAATVLVHQITGRPQKKGLDFLGLHLEQPEVAELKRRLMKGMSNGLPASEHNFNKGKRWTKPELGKLLRAVELAAAKGGKGGIAYIDAESEPSIYAHEATHIAQAELGGGSSKGHAGDPEEFMKDRVAAKAGRWLAKLGYDINDLDEMVDEIGGHLVEGESGRDSMGLTAKEFEHLKGYYEDRIIDINGLDAVMQAPGLSDMLGTRTNGTADNSPAETASRKHAGAGGYPPAAQSGKGRGPIGRQATSREPGVHGSGSAADGQSPQIYTEGPGDHGDLGGRANPPAQGERSPSSTSAALTPSSPARTQAPLSTTASNQRRGGPIDYAALVKAAGGEILPRPVR